MIGLNRESENTVTAEELHLVVAEAQTAGVLEESERAIISGIVRLADRPVREVMTPRTEVDWIDVNASLDELRTALREISHSRIPVAEGSADNIVGVIRTRDLLDALLDGRELNLRELARSAPVIPDLMDAMDALVVLRSADVPLALVHDEYGHFDGIVTPGSILAALAGAFAHDGEEDEPPLVEREDGSWLVSGAASADLLSDRLGVNMPHDRDYSTVAGFALSVLKHLPQTGETFAHDGWKFEVVDMDGRKIDKLLASRPKRRSQRAGARESRAGLVELAETGFEALRVAAREIIGLLDDPVALEAAAERPELRVQPLDLRAGELCQLVEAVVTGGVQRLGELRTDALHPREFVPRFMRRQARRWTGALRISPATSLVAAAASPARPLPSASGFGLAMCGRSGVESLS